jgi:hypothetical protein
VFFTAISIGIGLLRSLDLLTTQTYVELVLYGSRRNIYHHRLNQLGPHSNSYSEGFPKIYYLGIHVYVLVTFTFQHILYFVDRASRYNRVKKNQLYAQLILSMFRQPLHVSGVSRSIIRWYNRVYTTIGTYYSF